jgi:hypothetical protein
MREAFRKHLILFAKYSRKLLFGMIFEKFRQTTRNFTFLAKIKSNIFVSTIAAPFLGSDLVSKCCYSIAKIEPTPVSTSSGLCTTVSGTAQVTVSH